MSAQNTGFVLKVGRPYNPKVRHWPETPHLRMDRTGGVELTLFYAQPTDREVDAIRTGTAQFAWVDSEQVGVLAYQFGDAVPWSDTPYTPRRERRAGRDPGLPDPGGRHLQILVVLVDAETGIVRALRMTTWPAPFVTVVRTSLERMLAAPLRDAMAADAALDAIYKRYPDTAVLVRDRADATCVGGTSDAAAGAGPDASPADPAPAPSIQGADTAQQLIAEHVIGAVPGRRYPQELPEPLRRWYCYTPDAGHSIAVALAALYQTGADPAEFLVPAPVKAVQRATWQERDGFVVADLPYDQQVGLLTEADDDEF